MWGFPVESTRLLNYCLQYSKYKIQNHCRRIFLYQSISMNFSIFSYLKIICLFRTAISGIRPENLENAEDFEKVQSEVAEIIKDKIVVGQSIEKDMKALFLPHKAELLRDTSEIHKTVGKTFSLKELAANELGILFQVK